jgi:predicted nucleic-acid-binding Zn-ribbon protein
MKVRELRPSACGTRIGDIVEVEGKKYLQVKCRRCSKTEGHDVFHLITPSFDLSPAV